MMAEEFLNKAGLKANIEKIKALFARKATSLSGYGITDAYTKTETDTLLDGKVDKVSGKGLSSNDFTDGEKSKLAGLENYDDTALDARVSANETAIDTLNGEGAGSVKKTVADEIARVVNDAPEDFDTLKEISDWISGHADDASAMNTQIQANKGAIETLNGSDTTAGSVAKQVRDAVSDRQTKDLSAPITVDENEQTTVEGALGALNEYIDDVAQATEATAGAVGALQTTVGNSNSGLVKDVADNDSAIGSIMPKSSRFEPTTEAPWLVFKLSQLGEQFAISSYCGGYSSIILLNRFSGIITRSNLNTGFPQIQFDALCWSADGTKFALHAPVTATATIAMFASFSPLGGNTIIEQPTSLGVMSEADMLTELGLSSVSNVLYDMVSAQNLLAQATANLPNYYPSVSVSEGDKQELIAIKFSPGGSDDTFIFDLRGGERWLYAHGYNYQDINAGWNNQLVRLSPGANKLLTASNVPLRYDNTTHTLYVTRQSYSQLNIRQISGTKQTITVTRSTTLTVPDTATVTVNVSYAGVCVCTTGVSGTTLDVAALVQAYGYGVYHIALRGTNSVGVCTLYALSTDQYAITGMYASNAINSAMPTSTPINFASFQSAITSIQEVRKVA